MLASMRIFNAKKRFKNKRIAIVGAADSIFDEKNGDFIDSFDIVIRINKAAYTYNNSNDAYTGSKFTYLFHSFYENEFSGGGPIDFQKFEQLGIKKVIHPNSDKKGLIAHLNFYKRHLIFRKTYIYSPFLYKEIKRKLLGFQPTIGFSALYSVLRTDCKEVYITGFTFFKTPYAKGYRDNLTKVEKNRNHIKSQGLHNPEMEFLAFIKIIEEITDKEVKMDNGLKAIIKSNRP